LTVASVANAWWNDASCGRSKYADAGNGGMVMDADAYIVGGIAARQGEFPWQARLTIGLGGLCGGTIITPNVVLTAAHCTDGRTASQITVQVGDHDMGTNQPNEATHPVSRITQHASYSSATTDYDISLLHLATAITFNADVTAACQPANNDGLNYVGNTISISGWGTTSSGGSVAQILRYANVEVVSEAVCESEYGAARITPQMVCAGTPPAFTLKDTCQGDSGGPAVFKRSNGQFEVIGATSWGIGCASGYPGVYTDVPSFKTWITNNI
jgi:trypsin